MTVAPQIVEAIDDVSPQAGEVQYGQYTNDAAPVIRVSLGDQVAAGETLSLSDNGQALGAVTLTAAHLAQGYVDVPVSGLPDGWNLISASVADTAGQTVASSMSFALGVATAAPVSPSITGGDDGAGGAIADGGHTLDTTPTIHIYEAGLPPSPTGSPGHAPYGGPALMSGHIQLYEGDHLIGDALLGYDGAVTITPGELAPGEHTLTAVAVDRAGNTSAASAPFHIVIDAAASQPPPTPTPTPTPAPTPTPTHSGDWLQASLDHRELWAGQGADTLVGASFDDVLMGGSGEDSILGGSQFNNVNGNQGADTIRGVSLVGDNLLGGQGSDLIDASGSSGHNFVNGNLGADTVIGGSGGDTLRGGQADDWVRGGAGSDWISGDLGHNTLAGGGGADIFHAGGGVDLVTDFNAAAGDRVLIDPGRDYTASQSGADVVIDIAGQGRMVLAGVSLDHGSGWIIQA